MNIANALPGFRKHKATDEHIVDLGYFTKRKCIGKAMKVDEFIAGRGHKQKRPEIESSDSAVSGRVSKGEKKRYVAGEGIGECG